MNTNGTVTNISRSKVELVSYRLHLFSFYVYVLLMTNILETNYFYRLPLFSHLVKHCFTDYEQTTTINYV